MVKIPFLGKIDKDNDGQYIIKIPSNLPLLDYLFRMNIITITLNDENGYVRYPGYVKETEMAFQKYYDEINENLDEIMQEIEPEELDLNRFIMDDKYAVKVLSNPFKFSNLDIFQKIIDNYNRDMNSTNRTAKRTAKQKSTKKSTKIKNAGTRAATKKKSTKKTTKSKAK